MKFQSLVSIAFVGLTLLGSSSCMVGCQGMSGDGNVGGGVVNMLTQALGEWNLASLNGKDAASLVGGGGRVPSVRFAEDGSVSGFAGVNRFMTKVEPADLIGGRLKLDNAATTRMAGSPQAMQLEQEYLDALRAAKTFSVDPAGKLNLSDGTKSIATFTRGEASRV